MLVTKSGGLHEVVAALFDGAMIPVKVSYSSATAFTLPTSDEIVQATKLLETADQLARKHAPAIPPPFDPKSALWAAQVFHFACICLVDRIAVDVELPDQLALAEPDGTSASQHWSVDLVLRSWWDLIKRSTTENNDDPLNATLIAIASRWPLAAVGTPAPIDDDRISVIWNHKCLRQVYVDRVIQRADREKAADPIVAEATQRITGH